MQLITFRKGDRVVVPFNGSDGTCVHCQKGWSHLCDNRTVPGRSYSEGAMSWPGSAKAATF